MKLMSQQNTFLMFLNFESLIFFESIIWPHVFILGEAYFLRKNKIKKNMGLR